MNPMHDCCIFFLAAVVVGFQQTLYTVGEAQGLLSVCAVVTGSTERSVAVDVAAVPGTASGKLYVFNFCCCPL